MDLKEELSEHIIKQYLKGKEPDGFDNEYNLLSNSILDSFTVMNLVLHIEKTYEIEFDEIIVEHFESINALANFVAKKISDKNKSEIKHRDAFLKPINQQNLRQEVGDEAYFKAIEILPRLDTYYINLGTVLAPYIMRNTRTGFQSEYVNTDDYGFRFSHDKQGIVNSKTWSEREKRGLAIGNSYIFSFGSASDKTTVVSGLNEFSNISFLNLGVMAGNSTQEFIASIPFLKYAHYVLVCSGSANLFLNLRRLGYYELYGAFEGEDVFMNLGNIEFRKLRSMLKSPDTQFSFNSLSEKTIRQNTSEDDDIELTDSEMEIMLKKSAEFHLRDLEMIVRICGLSVPVFFALQPFAMVAKPNLSPEEKVLFDMYSRQDKIWVKVFSYGVRCWEKYTKELKQMCSDLKIPFIDINEMKFEGWCFIDPEHQTDTGYRQTAQYLI